MTLLADFVVSIIGMLIELFIPNSVEVAGESHDSLSPGSDVYAQPSRLRRLCFPPLENK